MVRDTRFLLGLGLSATLLIQALVFFYGISDHFKLYPGLVDGMLIVLHLDLPMLLMLLFVGFWKTRRIGFGAALPLAVLQICLLLLTYSTWPLWGLLLVYLPGGIALLVVGVCFYRTERQGRA